MPLRLLRHLCSRSRIPLACLCAAVLMLAGCQSDRANMASDGQASSAQSSFRESPSVQAPDAAAGGLWSFPAPNQLLPKHAPPRGVSYLPADLEKDGNISAAALPSRNVTAGTGHLDFSPDYVDGKSISGLAYATYQFKIEGYDLNGEVRLLWVDAPPAGSSWVGLANWDTNRWDWFATDASGRAFPASLNPYLDFGGDMLLIALRTGSSPSTLDLVRIGTQVPVPSLTTTGRRFDYGSLSVAFDPGASVDPDGQIVKYEYDFDADGSYDFEALDNQVVNHDFNSPGTFDTTLRVTDDKGVQATAVLGVSVGGNWERTLGDTGYDFLHDIAVAPDGSIWACGRLQDPDIINFSDLALIHFAADGTVLSTSFWRGGGFSSQVASALCVAPDGAVYVGGTGFTQAVGHVLFQRYNTAGELDWSHSALDFLSEINDMMVVNGYVYAIGADNDGERERGTIFRFPAINFPSSPACSRLPQETMLQAMTYFAGSPVDPPAIMVVGSTGVNSDADLLYFSMDTSTNILDARKWGAVGGSQLGRAIAVTGGPISYNVLLGAYRGTSPSIESCVLRLGVDQGYNLAGSQSVNILDMWPSGIGNSVYILAVESSFLDTPGTLRLTRLDAQLAPLEHYVFASGIEALGMSGLHYGSGSFIISGAATLQGGTFEASTNTDLGPSADWADVSLQLTNNSLSFEQTSPTTLQERELVFDTGAGNPDGMALMHRIEP